MEWVTWSRNGSYGEAYVPGHFGGSGAHHRCYGLEWIYLEPQGKLSKGMCAESHFGESGARHRCYDLE